MTEIDVIIPTTGTRLNQLNECLNSLNKQTQKVNVVIVLASHNNQTLTQFKKQFPTFTILQEPYKHLKGSHRAVACNFGLQNTSNPIVAFLDDDVSVPSTWAESSLKYFKDPTVGGVTSGCTPYTSPFHRVQTIGSDAHSNTFTIPTTVESIPGYNSIYLRKIITLVGGFSENIGGCEDWELNYRIRNYGHYHLLGIPETPVEHRHTYTYKSFIKQMFGYGWSRSRLFRKSHIFTPQHSIPTIGSILLISLLCLNLELFVIVSGLYFSTLTYLTYRTKPSSPKSFFSTIFTFIIMHTSWAFGYLKGLIE